MNGQRNKRAKACGIPPKVKAAVWERDKHCCVICWTNQAAPNAHFISRAHGGLGVEENIVTLCMECHDLYDHGTREHREIIRRRLRQHLQEQYPEWDESNLIYHKYDYGPQGPL